MAFRKVRFAGLTSSADVSIGTKGLSARYGIIRGFRCQSFATSAMAAVGIDKAFKIRITDANNDIVYLDALDRNYAGTVVGTDEVTINYVVDDTLTGLGVVNVDATGAAATAGSGSAQIVEGPVTVAVVNGGTATDYCVLDLMVEV